MDVDHPKGDFTKSHEDLYDSECDNKYVNSLPSEVNNHLVMMESPDQDCVAEVKETRVDTAFFDLVEPSAISLNKMRAEGDIKVEFSADISLSEHEHSASLERSRETEGNDVKDICVDEGLPVKEKTHVEDIFKRPKSTLDDIYPMKYEEFGSKNDKIDAEWLVPVGLKSCTDACEKDFSNCESKVLLHQHGSESETKNLVLRDFLKEKVVETISKSITAADDLQSKTSAGDGCKNDQDTAYKDTLTESEVRISNPISEETDSDRNIETAFAKTEPAKEAIYKYLQPTALNSKDDKVVSSADHPQLPDAVLMPRRLDPFLKAFEHFTASAPLQRDHFESSFASLGQHYSSSITYSGPIAHSGSLSHRSDASTASTRSFAFPVLKNEWNFSPVRMQKADRRHLRRHRAKGWLNGLFCCKV